MSCELARTYQTFERIYCFHLRGWSPLKMEAVCSSGTLVSTYKSYTVTTQNTHTQVFTAVRTPTLRSLIYFRKIIIVIIITCCPWTSCGRVNIRQGQFLSQWRQEIRSRDVVFSGSRITTNNFSLVTSQYRALPFITIHSSIITVKKWVN